MIHHVFNSSLVSGPETLVLPNLQDFSTPCTIVLLQETRLPDGSTKVADYARSLGFQVHEILVTSRFDFKAIRELAAYWKKTQPKLVHAHGPKASLHGLLAFRKLSKAERPIMVTTHHGVRANDQSAKLRLFEKVYEKLTMPYYDRTLTVCSSDRELLVKRGLKRAKTDVHLNGVDRKLVGAHDRKEFQKKIRTTWNNPKGFLVGVVGRLAVEKQYSRILQAVALLKKQKPELPLRLMCFGSGPLEAELKAMTQTLGLSDQVTWMGYRNDIASEMAGLDLLLSLSNAEGLPINLIEAGWAGTPVLAQGVDGILDLIEDRQSGVLLKPPATDQEVVDGLVWFYENSAAAESLGLNLQKRVQEKFSRSAWLEKVRTVYAEFLK